MPERVETFQVKRGGTVETYALYSSIAASDVMDMLVQEGLEARRQRRALSAESPVSAEVREILTSVRLGGV